MSTSVDPQALRRLITPSHRFRSSTTVAPVDHAAARGFSLKPFLKRLAPLIGIGDKAFKTQTLPCFRSSIFTKGLQASIL